MCSIGAQMKMGYVFCSLPDLSSSDNQVLGEYTVPGGPCILFTILVLAAQLPRCTMRVHSQVCRVSPLESWSQAVTLLNLLSLFLSFIFYPTSFWRDWLLFWVPGVLQQLSEDILWKFFNIQMIFWWICGRENGLRILFLQHLGTA